MSTLPTVVSFAIERIRGQDPEYPAQILPLLEARGADSWASLNAYEILRQLQRFGPWEWHVVVFGGVEGPCVLGEMGWEMRDKDCKEIRDGAANGVESYPSQRDAKSGEPTVS